MAQVLAVPGDVRHGFSYIGQFNHDFGRIIGIAATIKGNILLCDYVKKNLILVDPHGNYLNKLDVDSEPYGVAITSQNIGYITQPNSRTVLQIDPDKMIVLFKVTCDDLNTTVSCVSALPNTGRDLSGTKPCFFGVNKDGCMYAGGVSYEQISSTITDISKNGRMIGSRVVKFHTLNKDSFVSCIGGQNYIRHNFSTSRRPHMDTFYHNKIYNIATMDSPTDICSDDNSHIYVSGQGSNNIHRLVEDTKYSNKLKRMETDWKVLDIPLDSHHGIKEPVALCFNQDYSKLYIVNEWGKSVLVFDVI
ncbi:uncharacterized protein LOC127723494 [Mytilus californianus]|uniref:uncharacterized protein LOC127723494 n=1 Tax=Mytilus californianus TaxID=6549 RepID=UPI0022458FA5|nr:uncharacterized protein LOC127723494 [Mytilus californianus]XP_052086101.1 uncharacterized protein LOC127723494 [Mytilus californianus]